MDEKLFNEILQQIHSSPKGLEELYLFYYPKIQMYITYTYGGKVSGIDVAQEFFLALMQTKTFAMIRNPTAWVYRVCRNIAYKQFNKIKQESPLENIFLLEAEDVFVLTPTGEAEDKRQLSFIDEVENRDLVERMMLDLDNETYDIVIKHIFLGFTHREIADQIHRKPSTVRNLYRRGLKAMQKKLKE